MDQETILPVGSGPISLRQRRAVQARTTRRPHAPSLPLNLQILPTRQPSPGSPSRTLPCETGDPAPPPHTGLTARDERGTQPAQVPTPAPGKGSGQADLLASSWSDTSRQSFSVRVNIWGFAGQMASVTVTQSCHCHRRQKPMTAAVFQQSFTHRRRNLNFTCLSCGTNIVSLFHACQSSSENVKTIPSPEDTHMQTAARCDLRGAGCRAPARQAERPRALCGVRRTRPARPTRPAAQGQPSPRLAQRSSRQAPRPEATRARAAQETQAKGGGSTPRPHAAHSEVFSMFQLPPGPPPKAYQLLLQRARPQVERRHHHSPLGCSYLPLRRRNNSKVTTAVFCFELYALARKFQFLRATSPAHGGSQTRG